MTNASGRRMSARMLVAKQLNDEKILQNMPLHRHPYISKKMPDFGFEDKLNFELQNK